MSEVTRRSEIPIEHLDAELLASPFTSSTAFRNCLYSLDAAMGKGTAELWREAETSLISRFPGLSLDELVARRDWIWFGSPLHPSRRSLLDVVRSAGQAVFQGEGSLRVEGCRREANQAEWRRRWRWLLFALPADFMCAAVGMRNVPDNWGSQSVRQVLSDRGFAENHLHMKAAVSFETLWQALQSTLTASESSRHMFASPGGEFNEGRDFGPWLMRCALARLTLSAFLSNSKWRAQGIRGYLSGQALAAVRRVQGSVAAALFYRALRELGAGAFGEHSPEFHDLRFIYAALTSPTSPRARHALDPMEEWYPAGSARSPEYRFMEDSFKYLEESTGKMDHAFARLFWQCQRIRILFYRHIVQRPMTPGMQWFTRTYARLGAARKPLRIAAFVDGAVRLSGPGLKALELRAVPENNVWALAKVVTEFDRACRFYPKVEAGLIFHFSRSRGPDAATGVPKPWNRRGYEDPGKGGHNPSRLRFESYFIDRRREAVALADFLLKFPRMLERVRGVDLCTDEIGVPLWVLLPLVAHVRRAGRVASAYLRSSPCPARPLRTTIHAGEDYVHLIGGIRRIAEAVEFLDLKDGDRIGHGIALGVDVLEWAEKSSGLRISKADRIFDLVWGHRVAMRSGKTHLHAWLPFIENEIVRLAAEIFGEADNISAARMIEWYVRLHSAPSLIAAGFPGGRVPVGDPDPVQRLIQRWLGDAGVFARSQVLDRVDVEREVALIGELQDEVRKVLAERGVVVEINPASNLLIGHLGDLTRHPLWRLCPPRPSAGSRPIRVCIGSDDPITFSSSLAEEYQLLADALIEGGLSAHEADDWLNRARETGLAVRFTIHRSNRDLMNPQTSLSIPFLL